jgi:hypothetical protein
MCVGSGAVYSVDTIISILEGSGAVDTGEHGAAASALVCVKLRLLDDVVAGSTIDCFRTRGVSIQLRAIGR